jgi:crossover junction endodeoxyribonuclease RusA
MSEALFTDPVAELRFMVIGTPIPQGSKKAVRLRTGRTLILEDNKETKPWREAVASSALNAAAEQHWQAPREISLHVTFLFRRPKNHYGTGRYANTLKPNAPHWHSVTPDCDKCVRAVGDSLTTAGVIRDDKCIVHIDASKVYAEAGQPTGALITLTPAEDPQ